RKPRVVPRRVRISTLALALTSIGTALAFGGSATGASDHAPTGPAGGQLVGVNVDVFDPKLIVARDGAAVAAWVRGVPVAYPAGSAKAASQEDGAIEVATGSVQRGFSAPHTLARLAVPTGVELAGDAEGDAIAAWYDDHGR